MRVVMLMFDSLNRKMLEPYGCDWTKTPNFKRLAEHTVRFDQCYAGSLPCMPARRELHTGRYNFLHRSWGPIEPFDDSMPQILQENGIYSHLVSDHIHYWEDGGATYHHRYNSWEVIRGQEGDKWKCLPELFDGKEKAKIQNKDGMYFHSTRDLHRHDAVNRAHIRTETEMPLAKTLKRGLEYLDANHGCDNWFLQIECFDPHEPFFSPETYKEFYPDDYPDDAIDWPPYHHVTEDERTARHYKYQYAALLTMCDTYLGKLLDKFDELGLWDDTMLIVNTDHGYLLGEHGWWSKVVMPCYNEIVHIPLFIHDPRFACDGEMRDELVQTIDIPATILEYFGLPCPEHMQGRTIRTVIEDRRPIRDYALFGIHGAHVNVFDGHHLYMKAPVSESNLPLYEYTMMPTHMRTLFSVGELQKAEVAPGNTFLFTKGCPVWKIPKGNGNGERDFSDLLINGTDSAEARHIDNNSLVNAANFGDLLFDIQADPHQEEPLDDVAVEVKMGNLLQRAMKENGCPQEQFKRLGIPADRAIAECDIQWLRECEKERVQPVILQDFLWSKGAVNTYQALLRFVPKQQKESAAKTLENALMKTCADKYIDADIILKSIPLIVPEDYVDMVEYFVDLSGRIR